MKLNILILSILLSCDFSKKSIVIFDPKGQHGVDVVRTGLDVLLEDYPKYLQGKTIGLVTNQTGISRHGDKNYQLFQNNPDIDLRTIFAPEHGFYGEASAGTRVAYADKSISGPKIISLYGKTKKPTNEMLNGIDLIIYDIQDIGARFYTYISTLGLIMEAAGENEIEVMVLDRPNPIGGTIIEGATLDTTLKSFIGYYPIPIQYALTVGELSQMAFKKGWLLKNPPKLTVIKMDNWRRHMFYEDTDLPWVSPSPNIPDLETAIIYPGMCLYEATNVSEGRGTKSPFKSIGAPWMDLEMIKKMATSNIKGTKFKNIKFVPVSIPGKAENPKFENKQCIGGKIIVSDKHRYRSLETAIYSLYYTIDLYEKDFTYKKNRLDQLFGNQYLSKFLENITQDSEDDNKKLSILFENLKKDNQKFMLQSSPYYLYD